MRMTAREFIKAKGGPAAVAQATGHKPGAVSLWGFRNKLPRSAWPEIMGAFNVSLDDMKAIEARSAKVEAQASAA